jgi:hypothetical protein
MNHLEIRRLEARYLERQPNDGSFTLSPLNSGFKRAANQENV